MTNHQGANPDELEDPRPTLVARRDNKKYDSEKRTTEFGKSVIRLCKSLPGNSINMKLVTQVVGSAGSIGANYREANDTLGKKDFVHRLRIARKEAKESLHWLELLEEANAEIKSNIYAI